MVSRYEKYFIFYLLKLEKTGYNGEFKVLKFVDHIAVILQQLINKI